MLRLGALDELGDLGDLLAEVPFAFAAEGGPGLVGIVVGLIVGIVVLGLLLVFVLPAIAFVFEVLLVVVLVALGAAARTLLRRPWIVEADAPGIAVHRAWKVVGWAASGHAMEAVMHSIEVGGPPQLYDDPGTDVSGS